MWHRRVFIEIDITAFFGETIAHVTWIQRRAGIVHPQAGRTQVRADNGGYVYPLDRWARVDRFLILGSEGGTFYATEQRLTKENAVNLVEAVREDGARVVARVIALSTSSIASARCSHRAWRRSISRRQRLGWSFGG